MKINNPQVSQAYLQTFFTLHIHSLHYSHSCVIARVLRFNLRAPLLNTTLGTTLRSMVAELVCSAPSLHPLSPLGYLTELYPAQHV